MALLAELMTDMELAESDSDSAADVDMTTRTAEDESSMQPASPPFSRGGNKRRQSEPVVPVDGQEPSITRRHSATNESTPDFAFFDVLLKRALSDAASDVIHEEETIATPEASEQQCVSLDGGQINRLLREIDVDTTLHRLYILDIRRRAQEDEARRRERFKAKQEAKAAKLREKQKKRREDDPGENKGEAQEKGADNGEEEVVSVNRDDARSAAKARARWKLLQQRAAKVEEEEAPFFRLDREGVEVLSDSDEEDEEFVKPSVGQEELAAFIDLWDMGDVSVETEGGSEPTQAPDEENVIPMDVRTLSYAPRRLSVEERERRRQRRLARRRERGEEALDEEDEDFSDSTEENSVVEVPKLSLNEGGEGVMETDIDADEEVINPRRVRFGERALPPGTASSILSTPRSAISEEVESRLDDIRRQTDKILDVLGNMRNKPESVPNTSLSGPYDPSRPYGGPEDPHKSMPGLSGPSAFHPGTPDSHRPYPSPPGFHTSVLSPQDSHKAYPSPPGFHTSVLSPQDSHKAYPSPPGFHTSVLSPQDPTRSLNGSAFTTPTSYGGSRVDSGRHYPRPINSLVVDAPLYQSPVHYGPLPASPTASYIRRPDPLSGSLSSSGLGSSFTSGRIGISEAEFVEKQTQSLLRDLQALQSIVLPPTYGRQEELAPPTPAPRGFQRSQSLRLPRRSGDRPMGNTWNHLASLISIRRNVVDATDRLRPVDRLMARSRR